LIYGSPSFEIAVREVDIRPRTGKGSRRRIHPKFFSKDDLEKLVRTKGLRLLLDGQQRTTSIYRALKGIDSIYLILKDKKEIIDSKEKITGLTLEEMLQEFSSMPSETNISISMHDVYRCLSFEISRESDKINQMCKTNQQICELLPDPARSVEADLYLHCLDQLQNLCRKETLLSYYLLETNAEKFALFFERSNSKGVQLNFIDILAAKLYVGFNLREKITEFRENNPTHRLSEESLVRTISYIVSGGKQIGRAFILNNLNHTHFQSSWDELTKLFVLAEDYLRAQKLIISSSYLPYESLLIPLVLFIRKFPRYDISLINPKQAKVLHTWYWLCTFGRRYSSKTLGAIIEDSAFLQEVGENNFKQVPSHFSKLMPRFKDSSEILSIRRYNDAAYRGFQNLIFMKKGINSLHSGIQVANIEELEDHHVFPRDYLKTTIGEQDDFDINLADTIANRMLIPKLTNIRVSNKAPSNYLTAIQETNMQVGEVLEAHYIPKTLISGKYDNDFIRFIEDRAEKLFQLYDTEVIAEAETQIDYFNHDNSIAR
jgi:hypothetical protein